MSKENNTIKPFKLGRFVYYFALNRYNCKFNITDPNLPLKDYIKSGEIERITMDNNRIMYTLNSHDFVDQIYVSTRQKDLLNNIEIQQIFIDSVNKRKNELRSLLVHYLKNQRQIGEHIEQINEWLKKQ